MVWLGQIRSMIRLWRSRQGTASVELVLILPLLTVMLFGTIEIGRLLFDYHAVSKTVRDATRYLTRIDAAAMGLTCAGVNAASTPVADARNIALRGTMDGTAPTLLSYWTDPNDVQVSAICVDNSANPAPYQGFFEGVQQIPRITVTATVSFPFLNGWLLGRGNTMTFTISHNEAHFGV